MESEYFNIFTVTGLVILVLGVFNLFKALRRRSWPVTVGKIQKNETYKTYRHTNYWFNSGFSSHKTGRPIEDSGKANRLWLSYVYVVGEHKYIGNQLYSAPITAPRNRIFGLIEGEKVKVFYNPKNPHLAFLAHSFAWPSFMVMLLGVALVSLGIYLGINTSVNI